MRATGFFELALRLGLQLVALTQRILAFGTRSLRIRRLRIHSHGSCKPGSSNPCPTSDRDWSISDDGSVDTMAIGSKDLRLGTVGG